MPYVAVVFQACNTDCILHFGHPGQHRFGAKTRSSLARDPDPRLFVSTRSFILADMAAALRPDALGLDPDSFVMAQGTQLNAAAQREHGVSPDNRALRI